MTIIMLVDILEAVERAAAASSAGSNETLAGQVLLPSAGSGILDSKSLVGFI